MVTSLVSADSLLAIDIGTTATRARIFDVVNGHYRFLAEGSAVTTTGAPFNDVGEGVRRAVDQLHPQSLLQVVDHLAGIRLRDAVDVGGAGKAPLGHHVAEYLERFNVHGFTSHGLARSLELRP